MDILNAGTLGNYMKTLKLQTQWQLKQKTKDYTNDKKSLEDRSSSLELPGFGEDENKKSSMDVQAIYLKIQNGKKLTAAEKEYLRANDPEAYEKVKSIERERKSYEREIKRCKTKEEVQRVKMTRLGTSLSAVNSIANNPVIPLEKKLEYTMLEHAKTSAISEATQKFIESGAYAKLPTEAEYAEAVREMEEAKEPVLDEKKEETDVQEAQDTSGEAEKKAEQEIQRAEDADHTSARYESLAVKRAKQAKARAAYSNLTQSWESEGEVADSRFVSIDTKG